MHEGAGFSIGAISSHQTDAEIDASRKLAGEVLQSSSDVRAIVIVMRRIGHQQQVHGARGELLRLTKRIRVALRFRVARIGVSVRENEVLRRDHAPATGKELNPVSISDRRDLIFPVEKEIVAGLATGRIIQRVSVSAIALTVVVVMPGGVCADFSPKKKERDVVGRTLKIIDLNWQGVRLAQGDALLSASHFGFMVAVVVDQLDPAVSVIDLHDRAVIGNKSELIISCRVAWSELNRAFDMKREIGSEFVAVIIRKESAVGALKTFGEDFGGYVELRKINGIADGCGFPFEIHDARVLVRISVWQIGEVCHKAIQGASGSAAACASEWVADSIQLRGRKGRRYDRITFSGRLAGCDSGCRQGSERESLAVDLNSGFHMRLSVSHG